MTARARHRCADVHGGQCSRLELADEPTVKTCRPEPDRQDQPHQEAPPSLQGSDPTKIYRWHPCKERHTSWLDLGRCLWAHGTVAGDGPYAAASCGCRDVVLYPTIDQAWARKRDLDRDGCRPRCYQRHDVILISGATANSRPSAGVTSRATTPAASPSISRIGDQWKGPRCGRPRTNGDPCRRPAGWGADPGERFCRDHGGSVAARHAEKERLVDVALVFAQLTEKARTTALTVEEREQAEAAARELVGARVGCRGYSLPSLLAGLLGPPVFEVSGSPARWLGLLIAELSRRSGGEAS